MNHATSRGEEGRYDWGRHEWGRYEWGRYEWGRWRGARICLSRYARCPRQLRRVKDKRAGKRRNSLQHRALSSVRRPHKAHTNSVVTGLVINKLIFHVYGPPFGHVCGCFCFPLVTNTQNKSCKQYCRRNYRLPGFENVLPLRQRQELCPSPDLVVHQPEERHLALRAAAGTCRAFICFEGNEISV